MRNRINKKYGISYAFWITAAIFSGVFISSMSANGAMAIYSHFKNRGVGGGSAIVYQYKTDIEKKFEEKKKLVIQKTDDVKRAIKDIKSGLGSIAMADYEDAPEFLNGKSIKADLEEMKISIFNNGKKIKEFNILSKGRPGTPWETPSGSYRVLSKEENHLSSIGLVWMPYSMQFFGNFFIHGWPTNMDGSDVPEGYSGGCIRLSKQDAEEIFNFAEINTPVYISGGYNEHGNSAGDYYFFRSHKKDPGIGAEAYLVADLDTGELLMSKKKDSILSIASITKLITALVSLEVINQYQEAVVTQEALDVSYGEVGGLKAGEKIMVGDLIYPLLIESSNSAAEIIARHYGRSSFIKQMNNKAAAIGAVNTAFADPSGLSAENTSTVLDIFRIAKYIYNNKKYVLSVTNEVKHNIGPKEWKSNNPFAGLSEYLGGKTGYTNAAGQTMVSMFSLPLSEFGNRNIAIVVLGSKDREADTTQLVDYLKKNVYFGVRAD